MGCFNWFSGSSVFNERYFLFNGSCPSCNHVSCSDITLRCFFGRFYSLFDSPQFIFFGVKMIINGIRMADEFISYFLV